MGGKDGFCFLPPFCITSRIVSTNPQYIRGIIATHPLPVGRTGPRSTRTNASAKRFAIDYACWYEGRIRCFEIQPGPIPIRWSRLSGAVLTDEVETGGRRPWVWYITGCYKARKSDFPIKKGGADTTTTAAIKEHSTPRAVYLRIITTRVDHAYHIGQANRGGVSDMAAWTNTLTGGPSASRSNCV